jgi:hypothetical protein
VTTGRDDDALSWDGDDDPTLDTGVTSEPARDGEPEAAADRTADVRAEAPDEPGYATSVLPEGFTALGRGSEQVAAHGSAAESVAGDPTPAAGSPAGSASMGNVELIILGVLGGVYGLFAIGWLIGGLRLQGWRPFLVTDAMYQGSLWLAVLAPVLWFATVFLLTRSSRTWVRFAWLAAGVVLLVPWPFVMIGAVGQ